MESTESRSSRLKISLAKTTDLEAIQRLRHEVYANELGQYEPCPDGLLRDAPDLSCTYITAKLGTEITGMVGITPPGSQRYSVDKFLAREEIPYPFDEKLYEIRALTVEQTLRGLKMAAALMYGAFRLIEAKGGGVVVSIGRREALDIYLRLGMEELGPVFDCGKVQYHLIGAELPRIRKFLKRYERSLERLNDQVEWDLGLQVTETVHCYHGGAFYEGIGTRFDNLDRRFHIISADVLDAWFPPPDKVQSLLRDHLEWIMRTSPPTGSEGLESVIADCRGVEPENILAGGGSSDLIFLAFRHWLNRSSRVLLMDPTYGEYAHVLEKIVRARVERFPLNRSDGYRIDIDLFKKKVAEGFDLVVWVNPNSPTGLHVPKDLVENVLQAAGSCQRIWIDETYLEYAGSDCSLEKTASKTSNVIVCKSMSKVYALSGMRVAYLCAHAAQLASLRSITPPWAVSHPAQIAATLALQSGDYYKSRYEETHALRNSMMEGLRNLGIRELIPGVANFILFHLPESGPDAGTLVKLCREKGLYLRDASEMGTRMGNRAVRIAVKDALTNQRMLKILSEKLPARIKQLPSL